MKLITVTDGLKHWPWSFISVAHLKWIKQDKYHRERKCKNSEMISALTEFTSCLFHHHTVKSAVGFEG